MTIYILLILLALILISVRHDKKLYYNIIYRYFIVCLILITLFLLCVYRSISVGGDYKSYHILFTSYTYNEMIAQSIEPFYAKLTVIAQNNNNFLIIPAMVIILGIIGAYMVKRQLELNSYVFLAFLILTGFYTASFGVLREFLAMGVVYIGLSLFIRFYQHKIIKCLLFILFILMAMEFHKTSSFCCIFLLLPFLKCTKKVVLISGITTVIFSFTDIITHILNRLATIIPYYNMKYQNIVLSKNYSLNKILLDSIPVIIQFIFLYIYISRNDNFGYKNKFILSGYLLYLLMFSAPGSSIARRLQFYSFIFPLSYSCLFLNGVSNVDNKMRNFNFTKFMYVTFWVLFLLAKLITDNSRIVPYSFI